MEMDLPDVNPRKIKILVGNNIFSTLVQLEVGYQHERHGRPGAIRTPFGLWVSGTVLFASFHPAESPYVNHIGSEYLMQSVERF